VLRRPELETMEARNLLTLVMVSSPNVVEGATEVFKVNLNAPSAVPVTVHYGTVNATAIGGKDFTAASGTLTFAPGQTLKTVSIPTVNNAVVNPTKLFKLALSNVTNATLLGSVGVGTIQDNDVAVTPQLSINDPRVLEGNAGTKSLIFTVSLNTPVLTKSVSVTVATRDLTAKAGSDYVARSQVLTFLPGETSKQFVVTIKGDTTVESNEAFFADLSAANVAIKKATGAGWILNDD
jgi:hypothetical protein